MKKLVSFLCAAITGFTLVTSAFAAGSIAGVADDIPVTVPTAIQQLIGDDAKVALTGNEEIQKQVEETYSEENKETVTGLLNGTLDFATAVEDGKIKLDVEADDDFDIKDFKAAMQGVLAVVENGKMKDVSISEDEESAITIPADQMFTAEELKTPDKCKILFFEQDEDGNLVVHVVTPVYSGSNLEIPAKYLNKQFVSGIA